MYRLGKMSQVIGGALAVVLVFCASSVMAETITSPSYTINGNLGGNFGGQTSSTDYTMTSVGGEAIVGDGASGSYMITQQTADATTQSSLNLSVQPSGLAAYYPFEENTGNTTANASAVDAQATLSNGAAWTPGKIGSAMYFDGVDDAVTIPSATTSLTSGRLSVTGWVKIASTNNAASYQLITDRRFDGTNTGFSISVSKASSNIAASSTFNGVSYTTSTGSATVTDGQWHYFAYVVDANRINIYLDGVLKGYTSYTGTLDMPSNDIRVGQSTYNGSIDELKYFDRTLSAAEVRDEYNAQNGGSTSGLSFGSLQTGSSSVPFDAVVRADASYNLSISQNHDMQTANTSVTPDVTEPFSAATAGSALTTLNTSFTQMTMGANTTAISSNASSPIHGNYATFSDDGTASYSYGRHAIMSADSRYFRFYLRLSQYPSRTMYPFQLTDSTGGVLGEVAVDTAGKVRIRNQNTTVATSSTSLPLNQWTRVELYWNKANGTSTMKLFFGANADGTTPNETLSGAATGNNVTDIRWGGVYMPLPYSIDMDEMASSPSGWIGPVGGGVSTIAAIGGSISTPALWNEGITKGLGFSIVSAPGLDSRWGSGVNYAAFPNTPIGFYSRTGSGSQTTDIINMKARIDIPGSQPQGEYSNVVTVTGTLLP